MWGIFILSIWLNNFDPDPCIRHSGMERRPGKPGAGRRAVFDAP
jgi:hypothetical protein